MLALVFYQSLVCFFLLYCLLIFLSAFSSSGSYKLQYCADNALWPPRFQSHIRCLAIAISAIHFMQKSRHIFFTATRHMSGAVSHTAHRTVIELFHMLLISVAVHSVPFGCQYLILIVKILIDWQIGRFHFYLRWRLSSPLLLLSLMLLLLLPLFILLFVSTIATYCLLNGFRRKNQNEYE